MDDAAILALLSGIEPSEGEIPKPPFMAAIPAGPVAESGADLEAVEAWVKARGGWTHRAPPHLDPERPPLFFIVPKGHLQGTPGPPSLTPVSRGRATPAAAAAPAAPAVPAPPGGGLAGVDVMPFVATSDLAAARAFYELALGLKPSGQSPIALTFDCGGTTLRVALVDKPVVAPYTVLGFTVADMAATISDLTARGVEFERFDGVEQDEHGVWNAPGGARVAWFKDPDGNVLSLTQF